MRSVARYILFILVSVFASVSVAAGISYVSIETQGTGISQSHALASALSNAVAQVNGSTLESDKVLSELILAVDTDTDSMTMSASASAETVSQKTKGVVRDYRVLSSYEKDGMWTVVTESRVVKFERSTQSDRLKISVQNFRVVKSEFTSAGDKFSLSLTEHLAQSRRFAVLDRAFEAERQLEMDINASDDSSVEEVVRLGNRLGADLMVVGIVEDASLSTRKRVLAGKELQSTTGLFTVSYRIIDAATGQVKLSDSWSSSKSVTSLNSLINVAAEDVGRQITDAIYPISVESVSGNILYLGQGGKSIRAGQLYRMIRLGDQIIDSYTGESLGRQEQDVGLVEIVDVQNKVTKARVIHSDVDLNAEFSPSSFIVRLHSEPVNKAATIKGVPFEQSQGSSIKEIKHNLESSW